MKRKAKAFSHLLLFLSALLLAINFYGLRSPEIHKNTDQETLFHEIAGTIVERPRPPLQENYILWALSFLPIDQFRQYEFLNYKRALRAGNGVCSQNAILLADLYDDLGHDTEILALDGHVVAEVDGEIMDLGTDVILPFDISYAEKNVDEVIEIYSETIGEEQAETIGSLYAAPNQVFENPAEYRPTLNVLRHLFYFLKWAIPAALLILVFILRKPQTGNKAATTRRPSAINTL